MHVSSAYLIMVKIYKKFYFSTFSPQKSTKIIFHLPTNHSLAYVLYSLFFIGNSAVINLCNIFPWAAFLKSVMYISCTCENAYLNSCSGRELGNVMRITVRVEQTPVQEMPGNRFAKCVPRYPAWLIEITSHFVCEHKVYVRSESLSIPWLPTSIFP